MRAGEPLKIDVPISGAPTPTVDWKKDGKDLPLSDRVSSFFPSLSVGSSKFIFIKKLHLEEFLDQIGHFRGFNLFLSLPDTGRERRGVGKPPHPDREARGHGEVCSHRFKSVRGRHRVHQRRCSRLVLHLDSFRDCHMRLSHRIVTCDCHTGLSHVIATQDCHM